MDRAALDFPLFAVIAATNGEQLAPLEARLTDQRSAGNRPIETRERLYGRGGGTGQPSRNIETVTIQSILKGAREAIIDFDGAAYRLRITRNHRLILTK